MTCHVMSRLVMSCHVMSCHVISRLLTSSHVLSCHVISRLVTSCHVMSCHVMSCHLTSSHVLSRLVISCHVMSCHVTSSWSRILLPKLSSEPSKLFYYGGGVATTRFSKPWPCAGIRLGATLSLWRRAHCVHVAWQAWGMVRPGLVLRGRLRGSGVLEVCRGCAAGTPRMRGGPQRHTPGRSSGPQHMALRGDPRLLSRSMRLRRSSTETAWHAAAPPYAVRRDTRTLDYTRRSSPMCLLGPKIESDCGSPPHATDIT